ncbi:MAG: hypothetical protein ACRD2L_10985 [Terriglobia bacterium]
MQSSNDIRIERAAIHQLEVMGMFLGSHPDIVESMTKQEVNEELWNLGINPNPSIALAELIGESVPSHRLTTDAPPSLALEFIREDLAVRSGSLRRLFARLQEIEGVEYSWVDQICSNPKDLTQRFEGAATAEEFLRKNDLTHAASFSIHLDLAEEYHTGIDPTRVSIAALYPSGALRSVPAEVSLIATRLQVRIQDYLVFIDPDADQPTEEIASFWGPVTLFAIQC